MRSILVGMMGLSLLAMSTGCPSDDNNTPDAGNCTCTPPKAEQVSYDHVSSGLGADNAQDAIDELASRPVAEPPLAGRIENVSQQVDNSGAAFLSVPLECPEATDIALGGACGPLSAPGSSFLGFNIGKVSETKQGIACTYQQTAGNNEKPLLVVICLHKAGQ